MVTFHVKIAHNDVLMFRYLNTDKISSMIYDLQTARLRLQKTCTLHNTRKKLKVVSTTFGTFNFYCTKTQDNILCTRMFYCSGLLGLIEFSLISRHSLKIILLRRRNITNAFLIPIKNSTMGATLSTDENLSRILSLLRKQINIFK